MKHTEITIEEIGFAVSESNVLEFIGKVAGECYNSSKDSERCITRALNIIKNGHHSPWEHYNITLKCTVDRGVSHALVRHRHCSFTQSSTIYQRMDELTFVIPTTLTDELACQIEQQYKTDLVNGITPGEARDSLPNDLATNLVITTNIRQWMFMIQRRNGAGDSTKMHIWCDKTRAWFEKTYPLITKAFDDWYLKHPL